ncbi:MAG: hypothetical protein ACE5MB_07855 [Anaerolineae bacterium]
MSTVVIDDRYAEALKAFGEVDTQVNEAIEHYLIDRIRDRLEFVREREREYESKYGLDYETFSRRIQLEEEYYNEVNRANPLWEQDWLSWMYWHEEVQDWTEKLNSVLNKS